VIPPSLDGLQAEIDLAGRDVHITYHVGISSYGPTAVTLNGQEVAFRRAVNPYRTGGAEVSMAELLARLITGPNELVVRLG
jgi:hypothetical protein